MVKVELFNYQQQTINFLTRDQTDLFQEFKIGNRTIQMAAASKGCGIIYADMGLGTSLIAIRVYQELLGDSPLLIVATKRAFNTWRRELTKWEVATRDEITFVMEQPTKRSVMWRNPTRVMVVSYETATNDFEHVRHYIARSKIQMVIFDEAQKARNKKTKAFLLCNKLSQRIKYTLFLSGTIITRGPQDLWTFLHMCDRKRFASYWRFVNAFCNIIDGPFGREIVGAKNTKALGNELARCLIRIKEKDPEVVKARPPLTRDVLPITVTTEQRHLQEDLIADMYITRKDGSIVASATAAVNIMRMRQLMVCPKILDPTLGYGANIAYILDVMTEDPHIVIFTPFRAAVDFMSQAITETFGADCEPFELLGGTTPDEIGEIEEAFGDPLAEHRACICTVAFAESFELPSAKQCYFNGFEWSQILNYQAEKRLHRLTTPHPVNSYYLVGEGTIEQSVLYVLNKKQHNTNLTMQDYIDVLVERTNRKVSHD